MKLSRTVLTNLVNGSKKGVMRNEFMARAFCLLRVKPFDFADLSALRFSSTRTVEGLFLLGDKMTAKDSLSTAKLFIALDEVKARIFSEILPLCAHLAPEETEELSQMLEMSADSIVDWLSKHHLEIEKGGRQ